MPRSRPILVTGSHRSGTGWVAEILTAAPRSSLAYVWEPFSLEVRPGICAAAFEFWFTYVCEANESRYRPAIADTLAFRYRPAAEFRSLRSPKDVARMPRDWWRTASRRRQGAVAVMKDPIAVFSAPWLAARFDMDVVVMSRHPAACANSILQKGWRHPFSHFTAQPLLMQQQLSGYREDLERFASAEQPLLDQAILLWNVIHGSISRFQEAYPDWTFARHEDLSTDPLGGFADLYRRFDLDWDERVAEKVRTHSAPDNPSETADPSSHHRDSRRAIRAWRERLSADEISKVRAATESIASRFYTDDDW